MKTNKEDENIFYFVLLKCKYILHEAAMLGKSSTSVTAKHHYP